MRTVQSVLHALRTSLRSPARTPRMAVVVGRLLGAAFLICFGTGLYSHFIQNPAGWMVGLFPAQPFWLYQVSQGIHITSGILCVPLLLGKLYAVYPALFVWPPVRGIPQLLERLSIALFVAASLVEIAIGLLNTYQAYALFPFPFRQTHYALAFVVVGSLAIHIGVKLPIIARYWRRDASYDAAGALVVHDPEDPLVGDDPAPPVGAARGLTGRIFAWIDASPRPPASLARRTFVGTIAGGAAAVGLFTAGQSFGVLDGINLFAPRKAGTGPAGLPVNRTARAASVIPTATAADWRLRVIAGARTVELDAAALAALPQYTVQLPIACVEGWSQLATWRGPRVRDLMDMVGADAGAIVRAISLEQNSSYARSEMGPQFARDPATLIALELNGERLDLDHGFPARLIAPARPGVLQTKWLQSIEALA